MSGNTGLQSGDAWPFLYREHLSEYCVSVARVGVTDLRHVCTDAQRRIKPVDYWHRKPDQSVYGLAAYPICSRRCQYHDTTDVATAGTDGAALIAVVIGTLTGLMIARIGAHPILVTLGSMTIISGIGVYLTKGAALSGMPPIVRSMGSEVVMGVPIPMIISSWPHCCWRCS